MRRRDLSKVLLASAAGAAVTTPALAQTCTPPCWAQTQAEINAGVSVNTAYRPGDWRRYGADPTGVADSSGAVSNACKCNALAFDEAGGTYLFTSYVVVPSGVTVRGAGSGTVIKCTNGNLEAFSLSGVTAARVESLKILYTAAGTTAAGAVHVVNSTACVVRDVEVVAGTLWGVVLFDSNYCTVQRCYFHGSLNSGANSADIMVYNNASYNVVTENQCYGTSTYFGVMIQDPYTGGHPSKNLVSNNRIGQHAAYGIAIYCPTAGDSYNQVIGNFIEGILGSVLGGDSGAGIYVVGAGAGGAEVANNTVRNCCIQTTGRSLAPAAIGVSGLAAANAPVSVTNNIIDSMATYDGILVVSSSAPVNVVGNSVRFPTGNATGTPVRIETSSSVNVASNVLVQPAAANQRCILLFANGATSPMSQVSVIGNTCVGGNYNQIEFSVNGTVGFSGAVCSNNNCRGVGSSGYCISLYKVDQAIVSGNVCQATSTAAFWANTTTNCRVLGNSFVTTGATGAGSSGACTGWYDKSNFQTGTFTNSGFTLDV